jgi:alkylated DNA repair dioxygenase AlkB
MMAAQAELFGASRGSGVEMPSGFRFQEDILTEAEEVSLVERLSTLELKPFQFHGHLGNRRVISFGLRYDYARRTVADADEFPSFLTELRSRVAAFAARPVDEFQQCGVNQYPVGAGIGWHKDKPEFGVVAGISLLAPATMRLRRAAGSGWTRRSHVLTPRSIYILDGEARREWEHSIPPVDSPRYSVIFRTFVPKQLAGTQTS